MIDWLEVALPFTKRNEGCVLTAYPDPVSNGEPWTIGYGATGPDIVQGTVWTQEQADTDLENRLRVLEAEARGLLLVPVNAYQMAALVDFSYNEGEGALASSTLLRILNRGDYDDAADQFLVWDIADRRVVQGLENRRIAERTLFLSSANG